MPLTSETNPANNANRIQSAPPLAPRPVVHTDNIPLSTEVAGFIAKFGNKLIVDIEGKQLPILDVVRSICSKFAAEIPANQSQNPVYLIGFTLGKLLGENAIRNLNSNLNETIRKKLLEKIPGLSQINLSQLLNLELFPSPLGLTKKVVVKTGNAVNKVLNKLDFGNIADSELIQSIKWYGEDKLVQQLKLATKPIPVISKLISKIIAEQKALRAIR